MKDEKMISARISADLHYKLKVAVAIKGITVQDAVAEMIENWLADIDKDEEQKYLVVCEISDLTSRMLSLICETSNAGEAERQMVKGSRERTGREVLLVKVLKTETHPYL